MTGTQTPQKLFGDIPASNANIPGMVTPNITAAMPQYTDWGDVANVMDVANRQRELSRAQWARAAAINNARAAQSAPQGHYLPSTIEQLSSKARENVPGASGIPGFQGPVLWEPRNMSDAQQGVWAEQQKKKAMAENRAQPLILSAHVGDPYSPGEPGYTGPYGGAPGGSITGPGITTPLGGANPAVLARMWGGRTKQAQPQDVFPQQSLRERTSPDLQYKYDMFGGR